MRVVAIIPPVASGTGTTGDRLVGLALEATEISGALVVAVAIRLALADGTAAGEITRSAGVVK